MTKKDYEMVTKIIKERTIYGGMYVLKPKLIDALCIAFKKDNPKFKAAEFKKACTSRQEVD
jgi:hypothetical protein